MKRIAVIVMALILMSLMTSCFVVLPTPSEVINAPVPSPAVLSPMPSATDTGYKELEELPQDYPSDLARQNGDVVGTYNKVYNLEKLEVFLDAWKRGYSGTIRVTTYTDEGDAVIDVLMSSNDVLKLVHDNTRDRFSNINSRVVTEYTVTGILKRSSDNGTCYDARLEDGKDMTFLFVKAGK